MLVVCFHILAVKIYCLVVGFCDSQYFKALTLPVGHTVNFHENSNIAEIGHCVGNLDSFNDSHIWSAWEFGGSGKRMKILCRIYVDFTNLIQCGFRIHIFSCNKNHATQGLVVVIYIFEETE